MVHLYTVYYVEIKRNELKSHKKAGRNLKLIILGKENHIAYDLTMGRSEKGKDMEIFGCQERKSTGCQEPRAKDKWGDLGQCIYSV